MSINNVKISGKNKKKLLILIVVIIIVWMVLTGLMMYHENLAKESTYNPLNETESNEELNRLKQNKIKILENSYYNSLAFAKDYEAKQDLEIASLKFFDAKSIYPEALEPRMGLANIYYIWAVQNRSYCWQALKEVLYAKKYARLSEHPEEYNMLLKMEADLEVLCGDDMNYAFIDHLEKEKESSKK